MESLSDLEWANRLQGLITAENGAVDEAYRRRTYSQRACPECHSQTLVRVALPAHLRVLRKVRVDLRHYLCDSCGHDLIVRHREPR